MNDKVRDFWDSQAKEFGASDLATAPDHYYRELEIAQIIKHLEPGRLILDVGCGNGYSTQKFWEAVDSEFAGIDYSNYMIEQARARKPPKGFVPFIVGDVRDLSNLKGDYFDIVISERCLINLKNWEEQKQALLEMKRCLKPGGKIVFVENFQEGLESLNELRAGFGLHEIKVRWHNRYLKMAEFEPFIADHFDVMHMENIGNLYYIVSRVVYAAMAKSEGKEPQYDHIINQIASDLPTLGQDYTRFYSPNFLYVLRTK